MTTEIGGIVIDVDARLTRLETSLNKATKDLDRFAKHSQRSAAAIEKHVAGIGGAFSTLKGVIAGGIALEMGRVAMRSLDYAASLGEISQQLGVTTRDLQVYRYIAAQVGVEQQAMEQSLGKLTQTMGKARVGGEAQAKAFEALSKVIGQDILASAKTAGDAIPLIADGMAKIKDPTQRAALEVALFGKSGQKLDTMLSGGGKAIRDFEKRADSLNIVLKDGLIQSADEAADRIAELKSQLEVNISRVVAENAGSILAFANALATLTARSVEYTAQHPRLVGALTGAALGSRAGPIGAGIGAGIGYRVGDEMDKAARDANMDPALRKQELARSRAAFRQFKRQSEDPLWRALNPRVPVDQLRQVSFDEFQKQTRLLNQSTAKVIAGRMPKAPPALDDGVDVSDFLASGAGGKAKKVENSFADDLARMNEQLLRAKRGSVYTVAEQARLDTSMAKLDGEREALAIQSKVTEGKLTDAQAKVLLSINRQITAQELTAIAVESNRAALENSLNLKLADNDNLRDILDADGSVATTAAERRRIALRQLDLDKESERLKLQAIADDRTAQTEEREAARRRLAMLDRLYSARTQAVLVQTAGPLQDYLRTIPKSIDEISEAMQRLRVDQFEALNDRTRQFADDMTTTFGNVGRDILALKSPMDILRNMLGDLAAQFQEEFLIRPLMDKFRRSVAAPLAEKLVTDNIGGQTVHGSASPYLLDAQQMSVAFKTTTADLLAFGASLRGATMGGTGLASIPGVPPLTPVSFGPIGDDGVVAVNDNLSDVAKSAGAAAKALRDQTRGLGDFGGGLSQALAMLASMGGGGGGLLSTVLGFAGSALGSVKLGGGKIGNVVEKGPLVSKIPGFANGTLSAPGGVAWVGERGVPELVDLPRGARVTPLERLMQELPHAGRLMGAASNSRGGDTYNITVPAGPNDRERRLTARQAASAMAQQQAESRRRGMASF